jgi:predicted PolB exonuclease-like 3'-5' exonuclease
MAPVLVFDIETVPDVAGLRRVWSLPESMPDDEVAELAFARRREKTGSDFLPLHLHRVVAIGCLFSDAEGVRVKCLGRGGEPEGRIVQAFYATIDRHSPQLVSWNGSGFDLQVLHYRALVHGVQAHRYWDQGEDDRDFKWNNYIGRYHTRHLDLMDILALYNARANAPLDELAKLCGFPGKLGMDGSQVWPTWRAGGLAQICDYCETDVANTFLMYCRFQLLRGAISPERFRQEAGRLRQALEALPGEHWREFLAAWTDEPA